MKKRFEFYVIFISFSLPFFFSTFSFSQVYWNEWINHSQKYYKITVAQNGVYRIDSAMLAKAGLPLAVINPKNIQVFFRGEEQPIYIKGEADGVLNSSDYIEFYGKKNDGSLDSVLYKGYFQNKPLRQPNPYYSLFNDTAAYFLTWNTMFSNKRMIDVIDTNYTLYSPNNYFFKEDIVENHATYYYGYASSANVIFPEYQESEGWASSNFPYGSNYTTTINTTNIYAPGPNAELKLAVIGASNDPAANPDHLLQIQYKNSANALVVIDDVSFDGYTLFDSAYLIPASALGASTNIVVKALVGPFSTSRNAVPYVTFRYPHNINLENKSYYELLVPENLSQPKSYFSFSNFTDLSTNAYLYDFTNQKRVPVTKSGSQYKVLISNSISSAEKFCVIKSENQFLIPTSIQPVLGNATFTNFSTVNKDSAYIIVASKNLWSGANAYATYRSSLAGGGHQTVVVDIDELYDQFGYGIPKNPLAIRHFANFCLDTFPTAPQNLFLIGKSIQNNLCRNASSDVTGNNYKSCLIPSIAYPTCDNMLVAGLDGNTFKPGIPIGRLAAKDNNTVITYLNKVKEYELAATQPEEWMKHIVHISGGGDAFEQQLLAGFLRGYEALLEDTSFGGHVHAFGKNSSSPTQTSFTDSIKQIINDGISIINFFGHTSATVFDFNLLPPEAYNNTNGKYPFFNVDGCVSGDIHQPPIGGVSSSEVYTLSSKGVIGFLASSGLGTAYEMDQFALAFYKHVSQYLYGRSVGKCIQAAIDSAEGNMSSIYMNATCLEMTLHGDPAIVIHSSKLPDYSVNNASVFFSPSYVSTEIDSFKVNLVVTNIGKAVTDSVPVEIKRTFVDGTSMTYSYIFPRIYFKDTLSIKLPVDPLKGPGINKFEVRVDGQNKIQELDDINNNNILSPFEVPLLIYSGDIIPVYPYKCAIIPNDSVILKAYTVNPFIGKTSYIFEIDTTDAFNSPAKKIQKVTQSGGVVKANYDTWSSTLSLQDSTVCFWRVRRDTADTTNFKWRESSFQYISNKRGWGQSHFSQFVKGNTYKYISPTIPKRYFDLELRDYSIEAQARNLTAMGGGGFFSQTWFYLNGLQESLSSYLSTQNPGGNVPSHVLISVIDPITGAVWKNEGNGPFGSYACPPVNRFEFYTGSAAQQETLRVFLKDSLPCGSKIIITAADNHNLGDILNTSSPFVNTGLVQAFQSVGGSLFTTIQNDRPYILIGRKCGTAVEKLGGSDTSLVFLKDTIGIRRESGSIYSETFGPASKWNSLHWRYTISEIADSIKLSVIGIKSNGTADTLMKNIPKDTLDIYNLDTKIDASIYPYIKLQAWVRDSIKRTPAQLRYWRIYYDGVPDASLNPSKQYSFYNSSIQQGDSIKMQVAVENISDYDMDSLWVDFWVYDVNRNKIPIKSVKMDSLRVDSTLLPEVKFPSVNIPGGLNSLWIEANPFNSYHQTEQNHFNNVGLLPFMVSADVTNPILDVTFDGVKIMNGDVVSSKPNILITLKDENTFLALNDTSDFEVYIKKSTQTVFERIHFGSSMTFYPAQLPNNSCRINYIPTFEDGVYSLKVQAKDRTGNNSGKSVYAITFEVINKPTITNVLNYPNPFSTSTRFVFTLTGSRVPDYFKIQILTVTGKVVRELSKADLGHLHIGRNITDYAWDGKDEYGDQLANGLYLYRVVTQLDGKSLDHRESNADSFFTQGYGKMYLIR